jgi:hypothetical protein
LTDTLKIGDWIKPNQRPPVKLNIIDMDNIRLLENSVLWKPIENELCWFWNEEDGIKILSKFHAEEHNGFTEGIEFKNYKICIPFIGEIPTI